MIQIRIDKNDDGRRLDRFLRKYYPQASLSYVYKMIRKDVKVNGRRAKNDSLLWEGDVLNVYMSEADNDRLSEKPTRVAAKKQFAVIYEDDDCLIVSKPAGLLTHGDGKEKKNTLANQVLGYLTETGAYSPGKESTFVPAPANRLDRNTTGLVIFGKTGPALRELNRMLKERDGVGKYYLTIVAGELKGPVRLSHSMVKDEEKNKVFLRESEADEQPVKDGESVPVNPGCATKKKNTVTLCTPLAQGSFKEKKYTLVEAKLITGRTHQIRAQLAKAGYPLIGDSKYGRPTVNAEAAKNWGISSQILHGYRLEFESGSLKGKEIKAPLPAKFKKTAEDIFKGEYLHG